MDLAGEQTVAQEQEAPQDQAAWHRVGDADVLDVSEGNKLHVQIEVGLCTTLVAEPQPVVVPLLLPSDPAACTSPCA